MERKTEDAGVVQAQPERSEGGGPGAKPLETTEVWPRRFLERTPTLGWTPNLPDEEVVALVAKARRAPPKPFGSVESGVEADAPGSV